MNGTSRASHARLFVQGPQPTRRLLGPKFPASENLLRAWKHKCEPGVANKHRSSHQDDLVLLATRPYRTGGHTLRNGRALVESLFPMHGVCAHGFVCH